MLINTIKSATIAPPWAKAMAHSGTEFAPTSLKIIAGSIPNGLRGSFYRNGPARFERGGQRIKHWCDGDGAILGVHFTEGGATGVYRYVQTEAYQEEEKADKFIFGSYGRTPAGPIWKQIGIPIKNCANSAVLALDNRVLALWEAGSPYALDPYTLKTLGVEEKFGLPEGTPYSAHPKQDPETGDIFNFGVSYGAKGTLHLYRSDRTGLICQKAAIPLDGLPLIHDFVFCGKYLVFFIPPVRLNLLPFLTKRKSFSDALVWQPQKGTQILVIDRASLSVVSQGKAAPWFQWRFGNGYTADNGTIITEVVRYEDFAINQFLGEVATGQPQTAAKGTLWQICLDPNSAKVIDLRLLLDRGCEYPTVAPAEIGKPWRYTYLSVHRQGADLTQLPGGIACFDRQTGNLTEANLGENCYPVNPIFAPDADNPSQGWILTEVFDAISFSSQVWIFDANDLNADPICKLALPVVVPFGFHGTWKPAPKYLDINKDHYVKKWKSSESFYCCLLPVPCSLVTQLTLLLSTYLVSKGAFEFC